MPSLGYDARSMLVHDERSRLQSMDTIELLLDIWLYGSLLGKPRLRRVLLLFKHASNAQNHGSHRIKHENRHIGVDELRQNDIPNLPKDAAIPIHATSTDLLPCLPCWMAGRSLLRKRPLLVHIRERILEL